MENAIEALEAACVTVLLAVAITVFLFLYNASAEGESVIAQNISREWLISERER